MEEIKETIKNHRFGKGTFSDKRYGEKIIIRDLRNGQWFWCNSAVLKDKKLTPSAKLVYMGLADFANNRRQDCWPSISTLSERTNLHRDTVIEGVKQLVVYGKIKTIKEPGRSTKYILLKVVGKNDQSENPTGGKVDQTEIPTRRKFRPHQTEKPTTPDGNSDPN